jgi:hypothetical protein
MKAHLLQVLVVDDNYIGLDEIVRVFEEDTDYRDSIKPCVISTQSIEVEGDLVQTEDTVKLFSTLRPMEDAPNGEFVLLFGESGYSSTPLRCEVCKFYPDWGGWRTYSGDYFGETGKPEPVGWLPLPSAR